MRGVLWTPDDHNGLKKILNLKKVTISVFSQFIQKKNTIYMLIFMVFSFQTRITSCIFPADWRLQWQGALGIGWWIYSNLLFHVEKFFLHISNTYSNIPQSLLGSVVFFPSKKILEKSFFRPNKVGHPLKMRMRWRWLFE